MTLPLLGRFRCSSQEIYQRVRVRVCEAGKNNDQFGTEFLLLPCSQLETTATTTTTTTTTITAIYYSLVSNSQAAARLLKILLYLLCSQQSQYWGTPICPTQRLLKFRHFKAPKIPTLFWARLQKFRQMKIHSFLSKLAFLED